MTPRPRAPSRLRLRYAILAFALLAALLFGSWALAADGITLGRYVVAGGGGRVSAGAFTLSGSAGQPVAGPVTAGSAQLSAGFWVPGLPTSTPTPTRTPTATTVPTSTSIPTATATTAASATPTRPAQYLPQVSR